MAETKKVRITRNANYHQTAINGLLNELGVSLSMADEQGRLVTVMTDDQIAKFRMRAGAHHLEVDEPEQPEPQPADAKPSEMDELRARVATLESIVGDLLAANAEKADPKRKRNSQLLEPTPILG